MDAAAAIGALLLAAVVAVEFLRLVANARRAVRIRRALHELRRPLHSIGLALEGERCDARGAEACLEQARLALTELEAALEGRPLGPRRVQVTLDELARALEDRWALAGVRVDRPSDGAAIDADPVRLGAALDNLVANALHHGTGPVRVHARAEEGVAHFDVRDGGPAHPGGGGASGDPRHGHGLSVAAGIAASHGGTLMPPRRGEDGETIAALSVPTVPGNAG